MLAHRNYLNFEFESEGPNGTIKKIVTFSPVHAGGTTYFNLAFGHWDQETNELDDLAVSNNRDTNKILATVADTVIEFINHFTDMSVIAEGSNAARTRLYQMGISRRLVEIEEILDVYGLKNGNWVRFQKNVNYEAFLVRKKRE